MCWIARPVRNRCRERARYGTPPLPTLPEPFNLSMALAKSACRRRAFWWGATERNEPHFVACRGPPTHRKPPRIGRPRAKSARRFNGCSCRRNPTLNPLWSGSKTGWLIGEIQVFRPAIGSLELVILYISPWRNSSNVLQSFLPSRRCFFPTGVAPSFSSTRYFTRSQKRSAERWFRVRFFR